MPIIDRAEQHAELRPQQPVHQQLPPRHRRGKQELHLGVGELEQAAVDRKEPGRRPRPPAARGRRAPGATAEQRGQRLRQARRRAAAPRGARPRCAEAGEEAEIQIRGAGDRADQVPRLAQPPQPHAQPVPRAADDDVEARADHRQRQVRDWSWPVTRRKICSRFEPAVGQIGARRELRERAVGDLAAAVHDDHARADLLDQVQQVRRQQNRRAGRARARRSSSRIRRMPIGSSPVSGSSNSSVVASRTRPQAITTFCRMPRDSSPGSDRSLPGQLAAPRPARAARRVEVGRRRRAAPTRRRCSSTVRYSNRCGSSGMNASRRLASSGSATMSWPSMRDAAGGRPQNAGQRPQRRRLAGAVGADQADDLAGARPRTTGRRRR